MSDIGTKIIYRLADMKAIYNFIQEKRIKRNAKKRRVGFLCQYIPAWNKTKLVYDSMKEDERFEVFLICIPSGIENQELLDPDLARNDTYEYFIQHGYQAINALIGKNEWLDLCNMRLDYIFYPRPYNSYMPRPYTSNRVSRYSKICCLMYGMIMTKQDIEIMLVRDFFRNVYCYFAENEYSQKINQGKLWFTHKLGLQKTVYFGMPALAQILEARMESNKAWDFSKNSFRVMWTPRWTTDPGLGGTNFFHYKDVLLKYAREHEDIDFLLRPHPMMFENFVRTGEMTEEEVRKYKNDVGDMANVSFDSEPEYGATFWETSVLISDFSGIQPEYFVTGKPLIHCASNMKLELTELTKRMYEGCYVVETSEELFSCLEELKCGRDILYEKRQEIIKELFGNAAKASSRIVEELAKRK